MTLACLTAISSPLVALADTGLGGNASGSDHGGVVTSSGGDFGVNVTPDRMGRIGIRLSLVDANDPGRVISVDKDGNKRVVDILYVDAATFLHYTAGQNAYLTPLTEDNKYSAVKTQSYTEKNTITPIFYDALMAQLGDQLGGDMQPWAEYHDSAYYSLGNEFTTWCISDTDGNLKNEQGLIETHTISPDGKEVVVKPASNDSTSVLVDGDIAFKSTDTKRSYRDLVEYYKKGSLVLASPAADANTMYTTEKNRLYTLREQGFLSDDEYSSLVDTLDDIKSKMTTADASGNKKTSFFAQLRDKFISSPLEAQAAGVIDATGGNKVEAGTVRNSRIETLLTLTDKKGALYLQTPSMIANGTKKITEAKEDWVLLVEPIVYLTIFQPGNDKKYIISKQYGTISNIAEALTAKVGGNVANKAKYGFFNWKALNGPLWGALHVANSTDKETGAAVNGFKFPNKNDNTSGDVLTTPTNIGDYVSFSTLAGWNQWRTVGDHQEKVGYGVNVYYKGDLTTTSKITTWDEVNYPEGLPGKPEDPSDPTKFPDETDYGEKSKTFNIIKWYYFENADGTQEVIDTRSRQMTPHQVVVENEGNIDSEIYWAVEKWGTSLNNTDIPEDGSINTTFEEYYKKYKGTQSGKEPNIVTILPDDPDKSIYVKLVMKVLPKKDIDIVRVYENPDGSSTVEKELDVPYTDKVDGNSPKDGYTFEESKVTPDPIKEITTWTEVPPITGVDITTPEIPVRDTDKTVYIHYISEPTPDTTDSSLLLHEDEISKQFDLESVGGVLPVTRRYSAAHVASHGSHDHDDHSHSCHASFVSSTGYNFDLENQVNYNPKIVYRWAYVEGTTHYSGDNQNDEGAFSEDANPNIKFIFSRVNADTPTLYPNMNPDKSTLIDMGITAEGFVPAGTRKFKAEAPTRNTYTENFHTNWQFINISDPVTTWEHSYCGDTDNDTKDSSGSTETLNSTYSQSGNGRIYSLYGKNNSSLLKDADTSNPDKGHHNNVWNLNNLTFNIYLYKQAAYKKIGFYPYYRMKYTSGIGDPEKDAYLTSENLSEMLSVQRVDTGMSNADNRKPTLDLSSTQWSIHRGAQSLLSKYNITDKDSLLPAGGIYTLSTGTVNNNNAASPIWVGFRIFNSYVFDKSALNPADDSVANTKTKAEVEATIAAFKAQTANVIDNYEVVMYGAEGIVTPADKDNKDFHNDATQITGLAGSYELGQSFAKDSKYDLQTGLADNVANSSSVAILDNPSETYDWVLTADVDGNITITRNGQQLEVISKTQRAPSNAEVKEFDDRTKLVTNFINALDRNLGSNRAGNKWYNEAFSIGCIEERFAYRVGFGDDNHNVRSNALNIRANGVLDSRTDMFNSDEGKITENARSYQFYTSMKSTLEEARNHGLGWVGTYDGTEVMVNNIHLLLMSKRFYTSNTTVMDLN